MHLHHRYTYILSIQNQMNVHSIRYQQYKVKENLVLTWLFISILSSTSVTQYIIHHSEACDDQRCGGGQSGGGQ